LIRRIHAVFKRGRQRLGAARNGRTPTNAAERRVVEELAQLTREGRYQEAVDLAEENLGRYSSTAFLTQARTVFSKAGALTLQLDAIRTQRGLADTPTLAKQERRTLGKLLETSPGWRPSLGSAPRALVPTSTNRILHLLKVSLPYRQSGYTLRSKYVLQSQRAAGLEPVVMTALGFPRSAGVAVFPANEDVDGIPHLRLDCGPDYDLDAAYGRYLEDYAVAASGPVEELAPAVIHAHSGFRGYDSALVGLSLGHHFGLPVVYEVRGFFESLWTSETDWAEKSETYRRRIETENRCMAEADAVVTLSESMRREIVARGVPADRVVVVPNGVDIEAFAPQARSIALEERYGLAGSYVFGYVSNLDHNREGHELLVQAAAELRRRGIKAIALIVGDGPRRAVLEALARRLGADDAVVFTGRVPHEAVLDHYTLLDVFVVPRLSERAARLVTPLKPLEAMAAGVPLVTSDLAPLMEIIGDGERGVAFAAGDSAALADVLDDLRTDPDRRAKLAASARRWVVTERQWAANGQRYAELYHRLQAR
jgi:glycosyltransferase involved in cell wall biosynthesis